MLNNIIEFSVRNKLIIGLFIFGLICFGVYEVKRLPIDAVPDITDNQVQIITRAPSLGAPDVERLYPSLLSKHAEIYLILKSCVVSRGLAYRL